MFEQKDLLTWWTVKGFKGIVINRALPSLHGGSLEIILTVHLQGLLIFLNIHNTQIFGLESTSKVFCLVFLTLMKDVTKALRQVENIFAMCMKISHLKCFIMKNIFIRVQLLFFISYPIIWTFKKWKRLPSLFCSLFCASSKVDEYQRL